MATEKSPSPVPGVGDDDVGVGDDDVDGDLDLQLLQELCSYGQDCQVGTAPLSACMDCKLKNMHHACFVAGYEDQSEDIPGQMKARCRACARKFEVFNRPGDNGKKHGKKLGVGQAARATTGGDNAKPDQSVMWVEGSVGSEAFSVVFPSQKSRKRAVQVT